MANEEADPVFEVNEQPTRPGGPPRTATSRWRAFTSMALQRGLGRLSDEDMDHRDVEAVTLETVSAPEAAAGLSSEPTLSLEPTPTAAPTPGFSPDPWKHGPRGTVRMPARDRGPTGTVRIPRRTALRGRMAVKAPPSKRSRWWAAGAFAFAACAQIVFLAATGPVPQNELTATAAEVPGTPVSVQSPEPPVQPAIDAVDPPAVRAPLTPPAEAPAKPRGRRAMHASSTVF